jgi:error-prone DNA polymerase
MTEADEYVELHCASAFSFLEAGSQPETLIERAAEIGMHALALADRNGLYGTARFHTAGVRCGVRAHIGAEISVDSFGNMLTPPAWLPHQHDHQPPRLLLLRRLAIKIFVSSSRASKCANPPRPKAQPLWRMSRSFPLA